MPLVLDFEGTLSVDGNSGLYSGYVVIDVLTGFPVLSELLHRRWRTFTPATGVFLLRR
jgi:hypothetical protein